MGQARRTTGSNQPTEDAAPGLPARSRRFAPAKAGLACVVCECTKTNACITTAGPCQRLPPPHGDVCSACAPALGHIVSFGVRARNNPPRNLSVAVCACGFEVETDQFTPQGQQFLAEQMREHWRDVLIEARRA